MRHPNGEWSVGGLAAELDVNPRTIRYYERIGLLAASRRTAGGYRRYNGADRDRLAFILKAKATGLSLAEIQDVLTIRGSGSTPCPRVLAAVDAKLARLERHIAALVDFREELQALRHEASMSMVEGHVCGLIEAHQVAHGPDSLRLAAELLARRPARDQPRGSGRRVIPGS